MKVDYGRLTLHTQEKEQKLFVGHKLNLETNDVTVTYKVHFSAKTELSGVRVREIMLIRRVEIHCKNVETQILFQKI